MHHAQYFEPNSGSNCKTYSKEDIVNYNFYVWTISLYIGLQFSHFSNIPLLRYFVIDYKAMLNWTFAQWMVFVSYIVLMVAILTNLYGDYK